MQSDLRRIIAAMAADLPQDTRSHVYDHNERRHVNITGTVSATGFALYDHDGGFHISGSRSQAYHHGHASHFSLDIHKNDDISGYDHGSATHYTGKRSGSAVQIYDHQEGKHFNYQIS